MCLIVGCSRKSGGARGIRLCRVPAVVTNQGPEVEELSIERRRRWISAKSQDDLTGKILNNGRVCDQHFHSGTASGIVTGSTPTSLIFSRYLRFTWSSSFLQYSDNIGILLQSSSIEGTCSFSAESIVISSNCTAMAYKHM